MASLDKAAQELTADDMFLDLLRRFTRENRSVSDRTGTNYAPALFAKEDEAKKAGLNSKNLADAMRRLFKTGKIWNEPYKKSNRHGGYKLAIKS
jgi:hypothetical protein